MLVAGTPAQVRAAVTAAEPFRGDLLARGVLVAEVPVFDAAVGAAAAAPATHAPAPVAVDTEAAAEPADADVRLAARSAPALVLCAWRRVCIGCSPAVEGGQPAASTAARARRWRAEAVRPEEWRAWFMEQAGLAAAGTERGLYVSLRLDGRVRGSGVGAPPWERMVAQLPATDGAHRRPPCLHCHSLCAEVKAGGKGWTAGRVGLAVQTSPLRASHSAFCLARRRNRCLVQRRTKSRCPKSCWPNRQLCICAPCSACMCATSARAWESLCMVCHSRAGALLTDFKQVLCAPQASSRGCWMVWMGACRACVCWTCALLALACSAQGVHAMHCMEW